MLGEIDKQMMLRFLERNYPVSRIKPIQQNMYYQSKNIRFKRAIMIDDGTAYQLSEPSQLLQLKYKLFEILIKVFSCDESTSRAVLNNFLRLT